MALFLFLETQTMHMYYVKNTQKHCHVFLKSLLPWRDSNPGLPSLRRLRCPVRLAVRGRGVQPFSFLSTGEVLGQVSSL
jgi:hypothetical protein